MARIRKETIGETMKKKYRSVFGYIADKTDELFEGLEDEAKYYSSEMLGME